MKLTKKKKAWVKQFKPTAAIKGLVMPYNTAVQKRYEADLKKLVSEMILQTERAIKQIYKSEASKDFFAMDASIASLARIRLNKLLKNLEKEMGGKSKTIVDRMITGTDRASKSVLNQSLKELSGGLSIKTDFATAGTQEAITATFNANVDLIKSMGGDYLGDIRGAVNRSIQGGGGLEDLIPQMKKFLDKKNSGILNKAKNMALDQTRKAHTAITVARMDKLGMNKFEWIHSGGSREPRKQHLGWNGKIFSMDKLPVDKEFGPVLPGQAINCKCVMRPVIEFDQGEVAA
jgi:SPP1 gp7 family putative phage head morphogenesis protein